MVQTFFRAMIHHSRGTATGEVSVEGIRSIICGIHPTVVDGSYMREIQFGVKDFVGKLNPIVGGLNLSELAIFWRL